MKKKLKQLVAVRSRNLTASYGSFIETRSLSRGENREFIRNSKRVIELFFFLSRICVLRMLLKIGFGSATKDIFSAIFFQIKFCSNLFSPFPDGPGTVVLSLRLGKIKR